jgi:hypothetical protein
MHPIFKRALAPFAPPELRIVTKNVYPPIPNRCFDWCAYRDGDEESSTRYGWGPTEAEAVADLKQLEESGYIQAPLRP